MAFRKIETRLWHDEKVREMTSDTKLLWLYLLTGPQSNSLGCYVISKAAIADDLDWPLPKLERTFSELLAKRLVQYDTPTRLLFIINYLKHNAKFENVATKAAAVRQFYALPKSTVLEAFLECAKTHTAFSDSFANVSLNLRSLVSVSVSDTVSSIGGSAPPHSKVPKISYGEFQNVLLTEVERGKLVKKFGETVTDDFIERVSRYVESKGKKYKSHYATILEWADKDGVGAKGSSRRDDFFPFPTHNVWPEPLDVADGDLCIHGWFTTPELRAKHGENPERTCGACDWEVLSEEEKEARR